MAAVTVAVERSHSPFKIREAKLGATVLIIMTVVKKTLVVTRCTWFTFSPPFNFYDASVTRLTLQSGYLSGTILAWLGSYLYP